MKLYLPWQIIRPVTATAYELRTINWPVIYIIGFLAACMNIMLIHSYIPADATQTVICPTVKDKNGDLSDSSNYRPIAL